MGDEEIFFSHVIFVNNTLNTVREQREHLIRVSKEARFPEKKDKMENHNEQEGKKDPLSSARPCVFCRLQAKSEVQHGTDCHQMREQLQENILRSSLSAQCVSNTTVILTQH